MASIGIAGAGIGGLAAAALMARDGHRVTVFDRWDAPRPVGSGLVIQPVGQDVLAEIGALPEALSRGERVFHMLGHQEGGRPVLDVAYGPEGGESFGLAIHRSALFDSVLHAARAAGAEIVPSAPAASAEDGALTLEGGRAHRFDLVIDASGAASPLSPLKSRPLSYGAVWGTVDWPDDAPLPRGRLTQRYRRADRMVGVLPLGHTDPGGPARAAVFWSLPAASYPAWMEAGLAAWKAEAEALWPEVAPFLEGIRSTSDMTMARYTHGTMRRPFGPRLAHIGDAAHRASPQLGQGANMALLDALALSRALTRHGPEGAPRAYAAARRAHVLAYQWMSAAFTPQYQSGSRWLPVLRDRVLAPLSKVPPAPRILTALVRGTMLPPLGRLGRTPPSSGVSTRASEAS